MKALGYAVLLLVSAGCPKQPVEATSPESTYRSFAAALKQGNTEAAWKKLSKTTQTQMEARAKTIAEASKGAVKDDPKALLFQGRPGEISKVSEVKVDESTAVLEVASASGTHEVKLVKDSGHWFIDYSSQLGAGEAP